MNCNTSPLTPYVPSATNPWDRKKATHLYKRLATGISPQTVNAALGQSPSDIVDVLFDEALGLAPTTVPSWATKSKKEYENEGIEFDEINSDNMFEWQLQFLKDLQTNRLRERMTLFWSNHFVTEKNSYRCGSYMVSYYEMLQTNALGNFKDFVHDIGLSDAMLAYLNGLDNTKQKPNENYARELYELFTLGEENEDIEYTQQDIIETSKALTGYNNRIDCEGVDGDCKCQPIIYNPENFDNSVKTIFGLTGNWNYKDAIDILFSQKPLLIAKFIMGKLYRFFVSPQMNDDVVNELAEDFVNADFELIVPLKKLFKSEHFFDDKIIGTLIKSPIDYFINFLNVTGFSTDFDLERPSNQLFFNYARNMGQELFQPVDVAGWQGDYDWINTSSLVVRWESLSFYMWRLFNTRNDATGVPEEYRQFAKEVAASISIDISNGNAFADQLVLDIIHTFIPQGFTTENDYEALITIFKEAGGTQPQYYTNGRWHLDYKGIPHQVYQLLEALIRIPEFQLN